MSRISKIKKVLEERKVNTYRIIETEVNSFQQFYDLQKLETARKVSTLEEQVTIYIESNIDGKKVIGEASFVVSHDLSKNELVKLIDEALYQASFIKNDYYELVKGDKKKAMAYKPLEEKPFAILTKIAKIFFSEATDVVRFNALELFFDEKIVHLVNSNGVDYKKKIYQISCEAIPSFYSSTFKTELYRMFKYGELNYDKIKEDAKKAINECLYRGNAVKLKDVSKCNLILHDEQLLELLWEVLSTVDYASVYSHSNIKSIGENITTNKINVSLDANTKFDYFDNDGVRLEKKQIIKDGVVNSYFGTNRYAYYLNLEPTGDLNRVVLGKGKKSVDSLKKDKYIEIYDLSGIQVDAYQDYIGGEVRLALYYDGKDIIPISGFAFSASLNEALNGLELSKEVTNINYYSGPKFGLFKDVTFN